MQWKRVFWQLKSGIVIVSEFIVQQLFQFHLLLPIPKKDRCKHDQQKQVAVFSLGISKQVLLPRGFQTGGERIVKNQSQTL